MVISKRERYIAIGAIAAVALLALNSFALSPYLDKRNEIAIDLAKTNKELDRSDELFRHQRLLRPVWAKIKSAGLMTDSSDATIQARQAILDWTDSAGLFVAALHTEPRSSQQGQFQVIIFHITVNGPLYAISRLLWSTENAGIPLRVNEMQITPRKEGTDDLSVQLTISTISQVPQAVAPAAHPGAAAAANGSAL
jgi:hypothetical protein